jgi:hypothetical protein
LATFVRRIAFATCEVNFLEQMSRIVDDLTVLAEHDKLNQGMFDRFRTEFGIISEGRRCASTKNEQRSGNPCGLGLKMGE